VTPLSVRSLVRLSTFVPEVIAVVLASGHRLHTVSQLVG